MPDQNTVCDELVLPYRARLRNSFIKHAPCLQGTKLITVSPSYAYGANAVLAHPGALKSFDDDGRISLQISLVLRRARPSPQTEDLASDKQR